VNGVDNGSQISVEHLIKDLHEVCGTYGRHGVNAGVVHQYIQFAKRVNSFVNHINQVITFGEICHHL